MKTKYRYWIRLGISDCLLRYDGRNSIYYEYLDGNHEPYKLDSDPWIDKENNYELKLKYPIGNNIEITYGQYCRIMFLEDYAYMQQLIDEATNKQCSPSNSSVSS